jgi:hypothetical protein
MTTFDKREKDYEAKYSLDEELAFKATARRNKLLGLWAAEKLGKKGTEADQYAKEVVMSDFEREGDDDVVEKLLKDFGKASIAIGTSEIRTEMDRLLPIATKQVMDDVK